MKIAFIGLGRMGGAMAGHLAAAAHDITVVEPVADRLNQPLKGLTTPVVPGNSKNRG